MGSEITVRNVQGRYPHRPATLRSENIIASVIEVGRIYRIRLDDDEHPDAWLELTVEVSGDEVIVGVPLEEPTPLFEGPPLVEEDIPF